MDKTNCSLDGNGGGQGGWPATNVTVSRAIHPGTASKSKIASTLICGSNAADEALPLHIMFYLKTTDEKYSMNIEWCFWLNLCFCSVWTFFPTELFSLSYSEPKREDRFPCSGSASQII
jgi:hypothetical protein